MKDEIKKLQQMLMDDGRIISLEIVKPDLGQLPKVLVCSQYFTQMPNFSKAAISKMYSREDARMVLLEDGIFWASIVQRADLIRILESVPYNKDTNSLVKLSFKDLWALYQEVTRR